MPSADVHSSGTIGLMSLLGGAVVTETGLPRPLPDSEQGEPGEMPADRAAELAKQVFTGLGSPERHADLDTPTRQLLKACLQPEFRQCRDSYKEVVDGACRRQELNPRPTAYKSLPGRFRKIPRNSR